MDIKRAFCLKLWFGFSIEVMFNKNRPMMSKQYLEVCNGELLSSGVMMCIELINQCNDTEECYIVFLRLGLHDRFCIFYLG